MVSQPFRGGHRARRRAVSKIRFAPDQVADTHSEMCSRFGSGVVNTIDQLERLSPFLSGSLPVRGVDVRIGGIDQCPHLKTDIAFSFRNHNRSIERILGTFVVPFLLSKKSAVT